ncbi:Inner membrane protein yohC [Citrobacter freundii]|nr:Inner membrane protein yohC [Citrobacter freundii]
MNHVWGLFSHPDREMHVINSENESVSHHYTHHVLLMAAIPVVCAFIGTTQIGWNFGDGNILKLSLLTGFAMAILFYGVMLAGVAVMGRVIWWMARNYPQRPSLAHCMVFAGYVATPLFLSGLVALYPLVWLCALVGTIALFYTGYLLYLGIPTFLNITREEGLSFFQFDAGDRCVGAGSSTGYYGNPVGLRLPIILTDKPVCAALLT